MSRPWQFSDDVARSPFDRQIAQPKLDPASFKTNVNRNKSRKWTEAKNYTYDGDDWGGYDPYDEYDGYGNESDDEGRGAAHEEAGPSLPIAAAMKQRRNSFDRGDEQRSFSAALPPTQEKPVTTRPLSSGGGKAAQNQAAESPTKRPFEIRRDFTQPAHVPPPLSFRGSPSPSHQPSSADTYFPPPRKSSLSGTSPLPGAPSLPVADPPSPTPRSAATASPGAQAPFVRPSDIYKRMEEEKDRQRRESLDPVNEQIQPDDTTQSKPDPQGQPKQGWQGFTVDNPVLADAIGANLAPGAAGGRDTPDVAPVSLALPPVSRVASGFGSDFWGASELSDKSHSADASQALSSTISDAGPELTPSQSDFVPQPLTQKPSLGFTSVVHQAFDRKDDSSVPPTPISRDSSQTSGISPIMSRVPSGATAEARARAAEVRDTAPPPIAEEEASPSVESGAFARHSRNASGDDTPASFTPGYRRSLEPPSQEGSPARTPELEYTKRLSHPLAAESTDVRLEAPRGRGAADVEEPTKTDPTDYYSKGESDLFSDPSASSSDLPAPSAARAARTQFLKTHSPTLAASSTFPVPASRSPSPGGRSPGGSSPGGSRVRALAGQFNELHAVARSNSSLSSRSKSSIQSWERSDDNLPLKGQEAVSKSEGDELNLPAYDNASSKQGTSIPQAASVASFRPHLPGEWVSYMDTSKSGDRSEDREATPHADDVNQNERASLHDSPGTPRPAPRATEPIDLTPTTVKQKLVAKEPYEGSSPIEAVKAAGDALGSAIMASIGLGGGHDAKDFADADRKVDDSPTPVRTQRSAAGDVYLRPLMINDAASSVSSSTAPTPLSKDTPNNTNTDHSSYFADQVPDTPSDGFGTIHSPEEMESDRLRKEIERTLGPQPMATPDVEQERNRDQDALDGPANLRGHQQAENLPPSSTPRTELPPTLYVPGESAGLTEPEKTTTLDDRPKLLDNRFSWEQTSDAATPLFATVDSEPRAPYERPLSTQGLHIVNSSISLDSESSATSPAPAETSVQAQDYALASAPASELAAADVNALPSNEEQTRDVENPSTPTETVKSLDQVLPEPIQSPSQENDVTSSKSPDLATVPTTGTTQASNEGARIPPFREILALKSSSERIAKYNGTRTQFATTDTGLTNWLATTMSEKPEHASLASSASQPSLTTSDMVGSGRMKNGSTIMKMARNFGPSRDHASGSTATTSDKQTSSGPERQASVSQSGTSRGKDLMKSAGAFGGKATFGAKGLFAKAKGKLREGGVKR
ncbi:hypothetical protein AAFC00_005770 [Neodothiora populina]|uniref:Uncharacterized protein n=1 Tax=Neodothiora populina TaxID=2781224 RepID=A0ABR3P5T3_9PEZI